MIRILSAFGLLMSLCVAASADGQSPPVIVGVPLPHLPAAPSGDSGEALRQGLMEQLKARSIAAVPLSASVESAVGAEAQAKHCSYVLQVRVTQKRNVTTGFMNRLSMLTRGPSQEDMTGGAAMSFNPKAGDTVQLDYRIMIPGSPNPLRSDSFSGKVTSSGSETMASLMNTVSGEMLAVTQGKSSAAPSPPAAADASESSNSHSAFGGLFGHKNRSIQAPPSTDMAASSLDCAKIATVPNAMVTAADCEKLKAEQRTYSQAASDPGAVRPGDESMSCPQILAEMKQQSFTNPDPQKVARAQAATSTAVTKVHEETVAGLKRQAEEQQLVNAANAADRATEAATGGLVRGRALQAAEKVNDARNTAENERAVREYSPISQELNGSTADLAADYAQQLKDNPRLARLMQLANAKRCKGGG